MSGGLKIRDDLSSEELRRLARRERGRTAARMYAIANALDGMSRAESARLAGMERQALRDAVVRYNAEGLAGLIDRPKGRPGAPADRGRRGDAGGGDPARPGPRSRRGVRLDPRRSVPLDGHPLREDLPPVQPDAGVAAPGLLAAEGASGAPARQPGSAAPLPKGGSARP